MGVDLIAGGSITNQSGGVISGWQGIYGGLPLSDPGAPLTVVNAGSIAGVASGVSLRGGGYVSNQSGGTISGYVAIAAGINVGGSGGGILVNAGSIVGNMTSRYGAGVVLGIGGVTNQSGGTISGYDGIVGGGLDYPVAVENAGTIIGSRYAVQLESISRHARRFRSPADRRSRRGLHRGGQLAAAASWNLPRPPVRGGCPASAPASPISARCSSMPAPRGPSPATIGQRPRYACDHRVYLWRHDRPDRLRRGQRDVHRRHAGADQPRRQPGHAHDPR